MSQEDETSKISKNNYQRTVLEITQWIKLLKINHSAKKKTRKIYIILSIQVKSLARISFPIFKGVQACREEEKSFRKLWKEYNVKKSPPFLKGLFVLD